MKIICDFSVFYLDETLPKGTIVLECGQAMLKNGYKVKILNTINFKKSIHKQLAKVKPEKREQFEQRHSRELILYDAAVRYLKDLKDSGEGITPKAWQREIDQLAAGKQTDTLAMKSMREDLKAVERLRKTADQLSRQERDKSHDREPER